MNKSAAKKTCEKPAVTAGNESIRILLAESINHLSESTIFALIKM